MSYTEFYCDAASGSNLNGGDTAGSVEVAALAGTYNRGTGAGGTDRFTAAAGTPFSGISAGRFVAIKSAGGAAPADFVGRITAVNGGGASIDISLSAVSGTRPANATSVDARVGGAWKGPNGTSGFPFGFIANTLTNAAGDIYRVNYKSGTTYAITAAITHSNAGFGIHEGYTTTAGDGGRAVIDGGTSGVSYVLLTISGNFNHIASFIFQNNGASGTANGVTISNTSFVRNCVAHDVRAFGLAVSTNSVVEECETYACNQSNSGQNGGFLLNGAQAVRCISHDNTGSNSLGFRLQGVPTLIDCIADSNGAAGIQMDAGILFALSGCDCYSNGGAGILIGASASANTRGLIENCNLVKNGGYGIDATNNVGGVCIVRNCGFGSGSQVNTSGAISSSGSEFYIVSGTVTYASGVTPWTDPANGDFRINLQAAKGTGRGTYVQTASGYTGTVAYPDIGAAQSQGGGGAPVIGSPIVRGVLR